MSAHAKQPSEDALRRMFAVAISECRDNLNLSQEGLAERTGLSTSYLSLLERGKRNLTVLTAARIAAACNLKLSEFVVLAEVRNGKALEKSNLPRTP
jgi:transcriptional regulator with XRE-family HTH domain